MRTYVCGQCHVEYISRARKKRLVYPWRRAKVEDILGYYDGIGFKDWTHAESGAPVLKPSTLSLSCGTRAFMRGRGSPAPTAICPTNARGSEISDHHVRSPLLNINLACQTCHRWPETELKARIGTIQERTFALRNLAMDALVELINDLKAARATGMTRLRWRGRRTSAPAQFFLDFVEAENSMGFHARRRPPASLASQSISPGRGK